MKPQLKLKALLLLLAMPTLLFAQGKVEMADWMRSSGRIYVVVAVMVTILAGLVIYIIRIDRKISKLEKEN